MKTNLDLFKIYLLPLLLFIIAIVLGAIASFNTNWLLVKISSLVTLLAAISTIYQVYKHQGVKN